MCPGVAGDSHPLAIGIEGQRRAPAFPGATAWRGVRVRLAAWTDAPPCPAGLCATTGCWASAACSSSCWASSGFVFEASGPLAFKPPSSWPPPTLHSLTPLFCCPVTCPRLCPELRTFPCLSLEVRELNRSRGGTTALGRNRNWMDTLWRQLALRWEWGQG